MVVTTDGRIISLLGNQVGLTQREVSQRFGMAHSFLSKCETGERRIDVMELIQLAQLYRKPPNIFLNQIPQRPSNMNE